MQPQKRVRRYDSEEVTHEQIVQYIRLQYPNVIHRTDFAAGIKLPIWLAARQKRMQIHRGFPDIFIFEPTMDPVTGKTRYGLALELKKVGTKLKLNNGNWASGHIREQYKMLRTLNSKGYAASFACGFDEAKAVINWYLDGTEDIEFNQLVPKITLGNSTNIGDAF